MGKTISDGWLKVFNTLSEPQKRWLAAVKAIEIGYGGIAEVTRSTGLSRNTIAKGQREVESSRVLNVDRLRQNGGGRKSISEADDRLGKALKEILEGATGGDPMSALKWTCKSTRAIADELCARGVTVSKNTVHRALLEMGYTLQTNRKSLSRESNPNRNRQFNIINRKIKAFIDEGSPVISVDTKKKELVGNFSNKGAVWRPKGDPILVEDHDFQSRGKGKAVPYGTYDIGRNEGFVNVGISSDTADFALNSILRWWQEFGEDNYRDANRILICADGGGSNSATNRLWKYNLQRFADKTGLEVFVCHYPPGTSKWNKIEHRMFSYISSNWRGQPLESFESVVQLIGSTTTKTGLKIKAKLDRRRYKTGKKISDEIFDNLSITKNRILPKWNYSFTPI